MDDQTRNGLKVVGVIVLACGLFVEPLWLGTLMLIAGGFIYGWCHE